MQLGTPSFIQYYKIIGTQDSSPIYAMSVGYQLFCRVLPEFYNVKWINKPGQVNIATPAYGVLIIFLEK